MIELTVLLVSIVIVLFVIYHSNKQTLTQSVETFDNYYLSSCPSGYKSFYNSDGDMICCQGEVLANKCLGDRQCILNGTGTSSVQNCIVAILDEYSEKAKLQCPSSMMSYFEDKVGNKKGCTNGPLNSTLTSPKTFNQLTCFIYPSMEQNTNSKDSCYNQRLLDQTQCFGNNCTKEIVQPIPNGPVLIAIGFTDTMGTHRTAYTRQSMENFLNVVNPNWQNQGLDLSHNISVAEVAKAYYIDKTMAQADVQF